MERFVIGYALAIILATGAGAQERNIPKDVSYYIGCLREQTKALDDRVSAAGTIALAIVATCRASRRDYLIKNDPKSIMLPTLDNPPTASDLDAATAVVLREVQRVA
jgi:hypothetical protein